MRFDDMIATALAQAADAPAARAARWRQLVDLLAQHRGAHDTQPIAAAYAWLREARPSVDAETRRQSARALAGRPIAPALLLFFADDAPGVASPLIAGASLESREWLAILPRLGPTARSLLRHRPDLEAEVEAALATFGPSDFALEDGAAVRADPAAAQDADSGSQISRLVDRIEAYRKHRLEAPPERSKVTQAESFRWETGSDGIILWVEGAPRGPLVGQSIAWLAGVGDRGVDGQAAGGFERRAPFRDARFSVPGDGPSAGAWRISGLPYFDAGTGAFQGYRGTARRPRADEIARAAREEAPPGLFGTDLPADSLRQLIHELRTPLNAILGFAEMIEGEYLGPAATPYRGRATTILEQARALLGAVDDLDTAARLESRRLELDEGSADAAALLVRLHEGYERVAAARGAAIAIAIEHGLPRARVETGAAERMIGRLLAGTIGLAGEGETIAVGLRLAADRTLALTLDRPRAIAALPEADLLDPGYSPDGDWPGAPALGLGFALRLVRNLAQAAGGDLRIEPTRFVLTLAAEAEAPPANLSGEAG